MTPLTRLQEACLLVHVIAGRPMTHDEVLAEVDRRGLIHMDEYAFACFKFDCLPAIRANVDALQQGAAVCQ